MALTIKDRVKGGDGCHSSLDKFDPKEVAMGLRVELEHSDDPEVALDIVRDHLSVYPKYYTRLKKAGLADELEESRNNPKDSQEFVRNVTRPDLKELMAQMRAGTLSAEEAIEKAQKNTKLRAKTIVNNAMLKAAILEFVNYAKS